MGQIIFKCIESKWVRVFFLSFDNKSILDYCSSVSLIRLNFKLEMISHRIALLRIQIEYEMFSINSVFQLHTEINSLAMNLLHTFKLHCRVIRTERSFTNWNKAEPSYSVYDESLFCSHYSQWYGFLASVVIDVSTQRLYYY